MRSTAIIRAGVALALALGAACSTAANAPESSPGGQSALPLLAPRPIGTSDPLPDLAVGPVSVARTSAFEALRALLGKAHSDIGLTYSGAAMPAALRRPVAAANLEGRLPALVEQLAQVAGFFYRYDSRSRVLTVSEDRGFALALPQDAAQARSFKARLTQLGAVRLDTARFPGLLTYRAGRAAEEAIAQQLAGPQPLAAAGEVSAEAAPLPKAAASAASPSPPNALSAAERGAPTTSAPKVSTAEIWTVRSGEKVSSALRRWGERSGWRLVWQAPELEARLDASLEGTFEHAVTEVVRSLDESGAHLHPIFYAGNHVLRIVGEEQ